MFIFIDTGLIMTVFLQGIVLRGGIAGKSQLGNSCPVLDRIERTTSLSEDKRCPLTESKQHRVAVLRKQWRRERGIVQAADEPGASNDAHAGIEVHG